MSLPEAEAGQQLTTPAGPAEWGSDVIAEQLRALGIPYMSLTPGSSYRGLHDSLVNHLGGQDPSMVLCLHEQHAVAVAHGYAKAAEQPMLVALHANVGLMNAAMAVYNAFCDRVPMLIVGANGPWDAAQRRPWIDWLHSSGDPGALIRQFVRWDDQPASVQASLESLVRGLQLTTSRPSAPVYVCLDVSVQEQPIEEATAPLPVDRFPAPVLAAPSPEVVARVSRLLRGAAAPVVLVGRVTRDPDAWGRRVRLAEAVGARVGTDLKVGSTFPTAHRLHLGQPGYMPDAELREALRDADVVLSLDWIDLGGTLRAAFGEEPVSATVVSCSADATLHNGWSKDHFELPVSDLNLDVHPDVLVEALLPSLEEHPPATTTASAGTAASAAEDLSDEITMATLGRALRQAVGEQEVCLARVPLGWASEEWPFAHPLDCLGADGGGGVGSGPGMTVGAALALRNEKRLVVGVLGDGDTLMGASALWTAANMGLPVLIVAANNGSFYNDEIHQGRVAARRDRPQENAWIGVRIDRPRPDLAEHVRGLGVDSHGPIRTLEELAGLLPRAVEYAQLGPVFVDVHVVRDAYQVG